MISSPIAIYFILAFSVILALVLEKRYALFKKLGAGGIAILIGIVLTNTGLLPGDSPAYDFLMSYGVSAGIVLILLSVDMKSIRQAGPVMLKAFALGAVGSGVGSFIMALLLASSIGPETWKLAGQFTATYIGGGMNFAALGRAFNTSPHLFTAGIAADVILTSVWLIVCLAVPALMGSRKNPDTAEQLNSVKESNTYTLEASLYRSKESIHIFQISTLIVIVFGALWASGAMGSVFPSLPEVLWLTTVVLIVAQIPYVKNISGSAMLGNYLLLLFLACNGAKSVVANIIAVGPAVFYFSAGTIALHGLLIFGIGWLMKIDAATLAVASQANVGGPSSALALASARGYSDLILPGIAVGLLGYAVGNYVGLGVAGVVQNLL